MYEYIKPTGDIVNNDMTTGGSMSVYQALSYSYDIQNPYAVEHYNPLNPSGAGDYTGMYPPLSATPPSLSLIVRASHDTAESGFNRPSIGEINLRTADMVSLLGTGTYSFDMKKPDNTYDTYYRNYEIPIHFDIAATSVLDWSTQQLAVELIDINHPVNIKALDLVNKGNVDTEAITLYTSSLRSVCPTANTIDGLIDLDGHTVNGKLEHGRWQGHKDDWLGNLSYTGLFPQGFYSNNDGKRHTGTVTADIGPTGQVISVGAGAAQAPGSAEYKSFRSLYYSKGTIDVQQDYSPYRVIESNIAITGDFSAYLAGEPVYADTFSLDESIGGITSNIHKAVLYSTSTSGVDWSMLIQGVSSVSSPYYYTYLYYRQHTQTSGVSSYVQDYVTRTYAQEDENHYDISNNGAFWNYNQMAVRYMENSGVEVYRLSNSGAILEIAFTGVSNNRVVGDNPTIRFRGPIRAGVRDGLLSMSEVNALNYNSYFHDSYLEDLVEGGSLQNSGTYIQSYIPSGNSFITEALEPLKMILHHNQTDASGISNITSVKYITDIYTEGTGVFFKPEFKSVVGEQYLKANQPRIPLWYTEGKQITPGIINRLEFTGSIIWGSIGSTGLVQDPVEYLNSLSQADRDEALGYLGSKTLVYGQEENSSKEVRIYSSAVQVCGLLQPTIVETGITLFIEGISGSGANSIDLFIKGAYLSDSGTTLYILNKEEASGSIPLYIVGGLESGTMPLFIQGESFNSSGSSSLFINSTSQSGGYSFLSLFTDGSPYVTGTMNLFIKGIQTGSASGSMNLFVGMDSTVNNSLEFFVMNSVSGINNNVTLMCNAPSGTDGAIPYSGEMFPLFIQRVTEGLGSAIPFLMQGPSGINETLPIYINSLIESGTTLYIDGIGQNTNYIKTYIHGF